MKMTPVYTLYEIDVPEATYHDYLYFLNEFPDFDVSDHDLIGRTLTIGISYESEKEQKKLLKKLTKGIKKYYK